MYLDLICDNNYININIRMLQLTDLPTAVYTAELLNILNEVKRKQTFNEQGMFTLDRSYVTARTTLTVEEQYDCEAALIAFGMLCHPDEDLSHVIINAAAYMELITDETVKPLTKTAKKKAVIKQQDRVADRKAGQFKGMQETAVKVYGDEVLTAEIEAWVEAVYANKRFLTKAIIETDFAILKSFAIEQQKEILSRATCSGYADLHWVTDRMPASSKLSVTQQISKKEDIKNLKTF